MNVWRIGSNWGNKNLLELFRKEKIAFAGLEVDNAINRIQVNDLVCITDGQPIVAVGMVETLTPLNTINEDYANEFAYVTAIKFKNIYWNDNFPFIDFSYYDGRGKQFHKAGSDYAQLIWSVYNNITSKMSIQEQIKLLEFKKQIILQGPPGTGKTRLAKKIASEITTITSLSEKSGIGKVNSFFENNTMVTSEKKEHRKRIHELLSEFTNRFPKDNLKKLTLDDYCFGTGSNNSFCYWIEYVLYETGQYSGEAGKFKIYWKKNTEEYAKQGFIKNIDNDENAMSLVAEQLQNVVNEVELDKVLKKLSRGYILKLLNTYHPDKYFPINKETCINNALLIFGIESKGMNLFEKNLKLQELFLEKKKEFQADVTNYEFMRFLFDNFSLKDDNFNVENGDIVHPGEMHLVQFHPNYSYEDFIRGIVAKPTEDKNAIFFKAQNKLLGELAKKAKDYPTKKIVLIIDEINRANLATVLGELIYALEYRYCFNAEENDKKEAIVKSIYAVKAEDEGIEPVYDLVLPENLYVIGTMNTADRSVGHIDYAIRRRFAFVDVLPKDLSDDKEIKFDGTLFNQVKALFTIDDYKTRSANLSPEFDAKDVALGHSYFIDKSEDGGSMDIRLKYEIKPILFEYVKDGVLVGQEIMEKISNLKATI